jgi:hypothetical protein
MTTRTDLTRRRTLRIGAASALLAAAGGCTSMAPRAAPRVVVVGGGFGGATAARYLRVWSEGAIDVTLVEPERRFVSCPMSNLVLGGSKSMADVTLGYDALAARSCSTSASACAATC